MKIRKILSTTLLILAIIQVINGFLMYFAILIIPPSSFLAMRTLFVSFVERNISYFIIAIVLTLLMLVSAICVRKNRLLLPILSMIYLTVDFVSASILFADDMVQGFRNNLTILCMVSDLVIIVLYILYFINFKNDVHENTNITNDMIKSKNE